MVLNSLPFSDVAEQGPRVEDAVHVRKLPVRILPLSHARIFTFGWNFNNLSLIVCRPRRQILLKSVSAAFQAAIDADEQLIEPYLKVNQSRFDPETIPARKRYLNRRVKLVQTLVRWRKHSGEGSGVEGLVKHTVDAFIVPIADGGWDVGGEECLRKVRLHLFRDPQTLTSE